MQTILVPLALAMGVNLMMLDALAQRELLTIDVLDSTASNKSRIEEGHRKIKKRDIPKINSVKLVEYHNKVRMETGSANSIFLNWDDNLARNAKKWVEKCYFDHPKEYVPNILGQNLHFTSGTARYDDYITAVKEWHNEKNDYDYSTGHCKSICAHYVTMVKWDYILVGCAVHDCAMLSAFGEKYPDALFFACEYYSPFNDWPKQPYIVGQKCSQCPDNYKHCFHDLCMSYSYPIWNDTDIPGEAPLRNPPVVAIIFNIFLILLLI